MLAALARAEDALVVSVQRLSHWLAKLVGGAMPNCGDRAEGRRLVDGSLVCMKGCPRVVASDTSSHMQQARLALAGFRSNNGSAEPLQCPCYQASECNFAATCIVE